MTSREAAKMLGELEGGHAVSHRYVNKQCKAWDKDKDEGIAYTWEFDAHDQKFRQITLADLAEYVKNKKSVGRPKRK